MALTLLVVFVVYLSGRDDLQVWHRADVDLEFRESSSVSTFEDYLALEDRLFAQLDEQVYAKTGARERSDHAMLRLRWNPFYPYLEARTRRFLGLLSSTGGVA